MGITLQTEIIERLSSKGVLAYVAVTLAEGSEATTAVLAALVRCQTAVMLEGLKELVLEAPELAGKAPKNKWRCGVVQVGAGEVVQNLESSMERRKSFIDDLKIYWDHRNPNFQFSMDAQDGLQIKRFLDSHPDWTQDMWRSALNNRGKSDVNHAQRLFSWVGKLSEYSASPLDRYGKPMLNGGGKHEEAATVRQRNREAVESAISNA